MNPKDMITINLNIDWRVLVFLGLAVGILALAYSGAGAQSGKPPNGNDAATAPAVAADTPSGLVPNCTDGLLPTINGECIPASAVGVPPAPAAETSAIATTALGGENRHAYLTNVGYYTNTMLNACASGYHMASLWEILDVSNLTYDYTHPDAKTQPDSGYGPPGAWYGFVRTGMPTSNSATAGTGNCLNWTSVSPSDYGSAVILPPAWETAPGEISAWNVTVFPCQTNGPVWCVGN